MVTESLACEWHRAQGCPERGGSSTRARAFEADLSWMEFVAREVRVRRVVFVEPPNAWVAEHDATTPVRLEAVLVWIDGDRIGTGKSVKRAPGNAGCAAVGEDCKETAVGSINVQAGCVLLAEVGDAVDRVEDSESCRTKRRDDGSDAAELQALFEGR